MFSTIFLIAGILIGTVGFFILFYYSIKAIVARNWSRVSELAIFELACIIFVDQLIRELIYLWL